MSDPALQNTTQLVMVQISCDEATRQRLTRLAEQSSTGGRKVSPMQIAAQILEDALNAISEK